MPRYGLTCPSAATNGVGLVSRTAPGVYTASPTCRSAPAPPARPTTWGNRWLVRKRPSDRPPSIGHHKPNAQRDVWRCRNRDRLLGGQDSPWQTRLPVPSHVAHVHHGGEDK